MEDYKNTIENCDKFVKNLNSKLEEGAEPRYHTARIIGFDDSSDLVGLKTETFNCYVEVQNYYALQNLKSDYRYNIVVYDDKEHKILMYQLPKEDWYICHVLQISETWEEHKRLIREQKQKRIKQIEEQRPKEGKEYYLCPVNTDEAQVTKSILAMTTLD